MTSYASDPRKVLVIDDDFITFWHPKYDDTESDEGEYRRLLAAVSADVARSGTISKETFLAIWAWKGAMRVIGLVDLERYESLYAEAFRRAISVPPDQKLATLIAPESKLPGVAAPTGSTALHFIHPDLIPIIDIRTVNVLYEAGLIDSLQTDYWRYEKFRMAIAGIRERCPKWSLRQIDRALFAFHKQVLEKQLRHTKCGR